MPFLYTQISFNRPRNFSNNKKKTHYSPHTILLDCIVYWKPSWALSYPYMFQHFQEKTENLERNCLFSFWRGWHSLNYVFTNVRDTIMVQIHLNTMKHIKIQSLSARLTLKVPYNSIIIVISIIIWILLRITMLPRTVLIKKKDWFIPYILRKV